MKISRRRRHLRPRASRAQVRQSIDRLRGQLQLLQVECFLELARQDRDLTHLRHLNDHILDHRDSLEFWETLLMKRCALYLRVSTVDQHPETQVHDLRQLAQQRGYEIVREFTDRITGTKAKRPGLDELLREARRGQFDVVLVWASDRLARSVRHFLEVLDELNRLNIEFVSFREQLDTGGALGRAMVVIIGAIAELERNLIIERVRAGMRRARLEGRRIGRKPLVIDRTAVLRERAHGRSLSQLAATFRVSRASVSRLLKEAKEEQYETQEWAS